MTFLPMHKHLQLDRSKKARKKKFNKMMCKQCGYRSVIRVENAPMHWDHLPVGDCYCRCDRCGYLSSVSTADWYREQDRDPQLTTGKRDRE